MSDGKPFNVFRLLRLAVRLTIDTHLSRIKIEEYNSHCLSGYQISGCQHIGQQRWQKGLLYLLLVEAEGSLLYRSAETLYSCSDCSMPCIGQTGNPSLKMGEDKLSIGLQLWDEQRLDPEDVYSHLPRQSCRGKMKFCCHQQALEENQLQDKKTG